MTPRLDHIIKRELKLGRELYTVSMSPDGVKITLKGRRKGHEITWQTLLSGDAELSAQLKMSVDAYGSAHDE
jgi:hypothetical protein